MLSTRNAVRLVIGAMSFALIAPAAGALQRADFGTLTIQSRPSDSQIVIDGEQWRGAEGTGAFAVQLAPGIHRVEIRAPGQRPFVTEVLIRSAQTTPLNVARSTGGAPVNSVPVRTQGPLAMVPVVETSQGFMIAPDYRVSEIGNRTEALA
ncbi:MAG: PEGA domain-containing protein, partial [Vicinamibacterales bacterium]